MIQFGLIILVVGAYFVVCIMVRSTCSDCVPVQVAKAYPRYDSIEQPLANIPYFAVVASKFRIIIDTGLYPFINLHLHDDTRIKNTEREW